MRCAKTIVQKAIITTTMFILFVRYVAKQNALTRYLPPTWIYHMDIPLKLLKW